MGDDDFVAAPLEQLRDPVGMAAGLDHDAQAFLLGEIFGQRRRAGAHRAAERLAPVGFQPGHPAVLVSQVEPDDGFDMTIVRGHCLARILRCFLLAEAPMLRGPHGWSITFLNTL